MKQNLYLVLILHSFIWSSFLFVDWLSKKDSLFAKAILLSLFMYVAYLIAIQLIKFRKTAALMTIGSTVLFLGGKQLFTIFSI
ncbi:hypothetical protein [Metabacillus fastidiosus]|uniref:hypothetical protein n=1 Tax=Metabacillus fastidiosus TaxID=1458 RepID=UPI002DB91D41|nr:hypothetical protein [Metabacillus fastidiosus]MEC2074757.1 hypothetical protein [Metabacillus fastidiosus]